MSMHNLILCPCCGEIVSWNSWFGCYICVKCGNCWEEMMSEWTDY